MVGEVGRNPYNLAALLSSPLTGEEAAPEWRMETLGGNNQTQHLAHTSPYSPRASQILPTPLTTQESPQVLVEQVPWGQRMGS